MFASCVLLKINGVRIVYDTADTDRFCPPNSPPVSSFSVSAAIRQDRTRGGRSSYEGCSPHGKPRPSPVQRKLKRPSVGSSEEDSKAGVMPAMSGMEMLQQPGEEGKSHRQLVAILNHSNRHGQQVPDFFFTGVENVSLCNDQ